MLCAASPFHAAILMFVTLWNVFLAICQAWLEGGEETLLGGVRVRRRTGAGKAQAWNILYYNFWRVCNQNGAPN